MKVFDVYNREKSLHHSTMQVLESGCLRAHFLLLKYRFCDLLGQTASLRAHILDECMRIIDFYSFVSCNMKTLNIRATMKRKTEATNGPPIPATYDSPTQNNAIEITSTNIQTKAIVKFLLFIFDTLPVYCFFMHISQTE